MVEAEGSDWMVIPDDAVIGRGNEEAVVVVMEKEALIWRLEVPSHAAS
jgi:hypothetical protein